MRKSLVRGVDALVDEVCISSELDDVAHQIQISAAQNMGPLTLLQAQDAQQITSHAHNVNSFKSCSDEIVPLTCCYVYYSS